MRMARELGLEVWGISLRTEASGDLGEDAEGKQEPCGYLLMMVGKKQMKNLSGIWTKGSSPR